MNLPPNIATASILLTFNPSTGLLQNPDSSAKPSLTVNVNGVATSPTVVWTNTSTGVWVYSYTTSSTVGVRVQELLSATVSTVESYVVREYVVGVLAGGVGSGQLTITVTHSIGTAIQNATCGLIDASGAEVAYTTTNVSGVAVLSAPAGTYSLTVTAANFMSYSSSVTLAVGGNTVAVTLNAIVIPTPVDSSHSAVVVTLRDGTNTSGTITWTFTMVIPPAGLGNWYIGQVVTAMGTNGTQTVVQLYQGATYSVSDGTNLVRYSVPLADTANYPNTAL